MTETIHDNTQDVQTFWRFGPDGSEEVKRGVPEELPLTIRINGQEAGTVLCTPEKLNYLTAGFLYLEGIIETLSDVLMVHMENGVADVRLHKQITLPERKIRTSGCGGGVTFQLDTDISPVASERRLRPEQVSDLMKLLYAYCEAYRDTGGIHTSALSDGEQLLVVSEDLGRHNTLDKIAGECLFREIDTSDGALVTTGRISSEMLFKAARMGIPILISRTAPTSLAVDLARQLNITLIGYARARRFNVYAHRERIAPDHIPSS